MIAGVYAEVENEHVQALRGKNAVVFGPLPAAIHAAIRLSESCLTVDVVSRETATDITPALRRSVRGRDNIRLTYATEIACVDGVERIESVVLRRLKNGRLSALNTSGLFVLGKFFQPVDF